MLRIHVSLILVVLRIRVHRSEYSYCAESIESVVTVPSCPTSKEMWDLAASKKQCETHALRQNCTDVNVFIYHCVINHYGNETLEVCAPQRIIIGHCAEFNVARGIIQNHSAPCNQSAFPKCDQYYLSSNAYKYPDCYQLVYNHTTLSPLKKDYWIVVFTSASISVSIVIISGVALFIYWKKRHQCRKRYESTQPVGYELTASTCTLEDFFEKYKENWLSHDGDAGNNQKRHQSRKKYETTQPIAYGRRHSNKSYKRRLFIDDGTYPDSLVELRDQDYSLSHAGNKGNKQNRNIPNTRDTETHTTTDRLGYAMYKTEEDFREENKKESYKYLRYYRIIDKYFVETHRYIEAEKTFSKYGIVIFTGPPGCGKTIAAIHMIRKMIHIANMTFRKLQHWEELRYLNMNEKSLIFIDNIFFNPKTDKGIESWRDMLKFVHDRYHAVKLYSTGSYRLCIIMTVRSKVIASASGYTDEDMHILNTEFCVDTSRLTELEKNKILEKQIAFASKEVNSVIPIPFLDASFRENVILLEGPIGFPLCAHLFFCGEEFRRSGVQFFSRPIEYLKPLIKEEVEHDKSNKTKSLLLILFFRKWYSIKEELYMLSIKSESNCKQFLNKISPDLIANLDPLDFRDLEFAAQRLLNILVKGVGENTYDFVHDSVYEAVGAYFCETYVTETAMYFPLEIIKHQAYEKLTSEQTVTLVTRLMYEAFDKRLSEVFSCKIFESALFSKQFYLQLMKKEKETIDHFISVENESSNANLPCMFWTCVNNLTSLTELFYEIANERNIRPCYNLYVSLYGLCCYKSSCDMLMTDNILLGNLTYIRDRVLIFRDDEGNSIINILISSTFSDRFVALAIRQLLNDGLSTETINHHITSPLMIAVQQKISRIQDIESLVERSPKFHLKDTTGLAVLHHCLGSAIDDKTCAEILGMIIGSCQNKYFLSRSYVNGDTALTIAAKCSKHSRIQSILILLESCADMVDTINEDGLTPLHLAVISFKYSSLCVELECCVRVVILILNGADTDIKPYAYVKAIDECQYNSIRNILRHPKDKQIMKNELDCILEKLKKHEQTSVQSLHCLGKICEGLKGRITQAISYLQNMSFENFSTQHGVDLLT